MSSSRYREDRTNGAYPPRHGPPPRDYYPSPSSSHPYDSRTLYASSSTYAPPPLDTGSRFAPPAGGRSFDDRGYSGYPPNGPAYASSSRYDDRRDRSGREYDDRSGRVGDYRPRSPPPSLVGSARSTTVGREPDRTRPIPGKSSTSIVGGPSDPRAASRSAYRDLSPPAIAPLPVREDLKAVAPPPGKASYERSAKGQPSSTSSTTVPLPQGSPEFEPGELVPTPKSNAVDLPPISDPVPQARSVGGGGSTRGGEAYERSRAEPTWAGYPPSSYPAGSGYESRGPSSNYDSRYAREPAYAPPLQPLTYPPTDYTRGSSSAYPPSASRGHSPPPRQIDSIPQSSTSRQPRSPETSRRRRSSSPPVYRSSHTRSHSHTQSKSQPKSHRDRGRSRTRSPPSLDSSISPPPKSRRRRRGSSCSSVSRSPSPPPAGRRKSSKSSKRRSSTRGRSMSRSPRSPTSSSERSRSKSNRSASHSPGVNRGSRNKSSRKSKSSKKGDKRPRSPDPKGTDRSYDKKAKVSTSSSSSRPSNDIKSNEPDPTTRYATSNSTATLPPRAPLPTSSLNRLPPPTNSTTLPISPAPASYDRPFYSGPGASFNHAPTGPRAFRTPLPGQPAPFPSPSNNGLLLPHGTRVMVDVPKGPKPKAGFAPIKTTQVAGPPGSVPVPAVAATIAATKAGGIKKFFPGEEEEEEERRKAKAAKEREEKLKAEKERERIAKEKAEAKEKEERERERDREREREREREKEKERQRLKDRDRYRKEDRMDIDDDRYSSSRKDRDRGSYRGRSRSRSRSRSTSRSRSRSRSRSKSRSRSRSRSRERSREREKEREKERDRKNKSGSDSRDGWLVRDGGDVPPPRVRPLNDDEDVRPTPPQQPPRLPPVAPRGNGIPLGPRASNGGLPTGPAATHARPPASYERPTAPKNAFNPLGSSNAVVSGVSQRKWGTPAARPPSGPATPTTPRNGLPSPAPVLTPSRPILPPTGPAQPTVQKGGWSRPPTNSNVIPPPPPPPLATPAPPAPAPSSEAGTPPLAARPLPTAPSLPTPTVEPSKPPSPEPLPKESPVPLEAAVPASATPSIAPTPIPSIVEPPAPQPTELYERLVQVGEGTYGKVYKARNVESGNLVALKRIRMEAEKDGFPVTAVREIKLLQNLRHPNVVDLIEMLVSKGHVYMVMEYMDHDLTGVLHHPTISFSPAHLKSLMKQFLEGLGFIHRRGVLHRDLKGSNILLGKSGELKIADFGLARFFARGRNNDYTNRVITQWYKPPELLFGATIYGEEVDMWSAGCIFLELFARRPVFQGQDEIHQLEVIFKVTGTPSVENWPGLQDLPWYELVKPKTILPSQLRSVFSKWISPAGLDLAEQLLSLNPAGRPTADEALRLPYFTTEDPKPELPVFLSSVTGEWHELESKRARRKAREEVA